MASEPEFYYPSRPLHREKLEQDPQLLADNKLFWEGLTRAWLDAYERAFRLRAPDAKEWQKQVNEAVRQAGVAYLDCKLPAFAKKWSPRWKKPFHPADVDQVIRQIAMRGFEEAQRPPPLTERELWNHLKQGELDRASIKQLVELFRELKSNQGPIWLPLGTPPLEVVVILAKALCDLRRVRKIEAERRKVKAKKKAFRRRPLPEDLSALTPQEEQVLVDYLKASYEYDRWKGFVGPVWQEGRTLQATRARTGRQFVLRTAVEALCRLFEGKSSWTSRGHFPLIGALLNRVGLLGKVSTAADWQKALARLRQMKPRS